MVDLVEWLTACLDEDERIARAVEDRSAPWDGQWMADGNSAVRTYNGHVLFYRHDSGPLKPGLADHVAEWDPARVLREIDAKRRILAQYVKAAQAAEELSAVRDRLSARGQDTLMTGLELESAVHRRDTLQGVLRLHAAVYSGRPGFREEWAL